MGRRIVFVVGHRCETDLAELIVDVNGAVVRIRDVAAAAGEAQRKVVAFERHVPKAIGGATLDRVRLIASRIDTGDERYFITRCG